MAALFDTFGKMNFSVSFNPTSAFPLDARSIFASIEGARDAASNARGVGSSDSPYYFGMALTVIDTDAGEVTMYVIEPNDAANPAAGGKLKKVGSVDLQGDDKTIAVTDGVLSLKNFGNEYNKWVSADNIIEGDYTTENLPSTSVAAFAKVGNAWYEYAVGEGWKEATREPIEAGYYEKVTGSFKAGLTPRSTARDGGGYILEWYEASDADAAGQIGDLSALKDTVNKNKAAIDILVANSETEGSVDNKIATAIAALLENDGEEGVIDSLKDLIDWVNSHEIDATQYGKDIAANKTAIANLTTLIGEIPSGSSATNIIEYINTVMATGAGVKKVEKGENGHIIITNSDDSTSDIHVYDLPVATTLELGGVKVDGVTIGINAEGVISTLNTVSTDDLTTALEGAKTEILADAAEAADEKYVAKNVISTSDTFNAEAASTTNVVSEELLAAKMTWSETM